MCWHGFQDKEREGGGMEGRIEIETLNKGNDDIDENENENDDDDDINNDDDDIKQRVEVEPTSRKRMTLGCSSLRWLRISRSTFTESISPAVWGTHLAATSSPVRRSRISLVTPVSPAPS